MKKIMAIFLLGNSLHLFANAEDKADTDMIACKQLQTLNSDVDVKKGQVTAEQYVNSEEACQEEIAHFKERQVLDEARIIYPYALLNDATYRFPIKNVSGFKRLDAQSYPVSWRDHFIHKTNDPKYPDGKGMLLQYKSINMWAALYEDEATKDLVLVFRGSELDPKKTGEMASNFKTATEQWLGYIPTHFTKALELTESVKKLHPSKKLTIVGSSLGGALAQYTGLATGSKFFAFNSLGLNKAELSEITRKRPEALHTVQETAVLVSIQGDMVSDTHENMSLFFNQYVGTVVKIPFYDQSLYGYYSSVHHTSDAIVKSIDKFIKDQEEDADVTKKDQTVKTIDVKSVGKVDVASLGQGLGLNAFKVYNDTKYTVELLVFACTELDDADGNPSTICEKSLFDYPASGRSNAYPHLALPKFLNFLNATLADPSFQKIIIDPASGGKPNIPTVEIKSGRYGFSERIGKWHYVTAVNTSPTCKTKVDGADKYEGRLEHKGHWVKSYFFEQQGWFGIDYKSNPKVLKITSETKDPCSLEIEGIR